MCQNVSKTAKGEKTVGGLMPCWMIQPTAVMNPSSDQCKLHSFTKHVHRISPFFRYPFDLSATLCPNKISLFYGCFHFYTIVYQLPKGTTKLNTIRVAVLCCTYTHISTQGKHGRITSKAGCF